MRIGGAIVFGLFGLALLGPAWADTRVALVIGNSGYRNVAPLTNPAKDAAQVAAALKRIGFTSVDVQYDLGAAGMRAALQTFTRKAEDADVAVVYYAGHGMEVGGTNYLIPVDAALARETDLNFEAIPLGMVMDTVSSARRLKMVVLDACRNNPFSGHMKGGGTRAIGRGLARVEPDGTNTLVAYAAKDGTTADDGSGEHSPFAVAFVKEITTPGLEVRLLFGKVRDDVYQATNKKQEPFVYGSLGGDAFYFVAPAGSATAVVIEPKSTGIDPKQIELAFWQSVSAGDDEAALQSYLDKYPQGEFSALARAKIAVLKKKGKQTAMAAPPPPAVDAKALELALWNAVAASNDAAQLQSYLDKYPGGTFANVARAKIVALQNRASASPAVVAAPGRTRASRADGKAVAVAYKLQTKILQIVQRAEEAARLGREAAAADKAKPQNGSGTGGTWQYSGGSRMLGIGSHYGVTVWSDGARYEGDWRSGQRDGYGVCTYADGSRYAGEWRGDRRAGMGVETDPDGSRIQGEWRDDKLNGYGAKYDAAGTLVEADTYSYGAPRNGVRR